MRNRILFLLVSIVTGFSQAQTGIIALKSHSGQLAELSNHGDNFGDPPMDFPMYLPGTPDTLTYLGNNCVQIKSSKFVSYCDTLCNDPLFKEFNYNPELLKNELAPGTVFKDFEKRKDEGSTRPMKSRPSRSQSPWIIVLIGIGTFGLVIRKKLSPSNT